MITKRVLDRAKAFLCWDVFPELTIQLIALEGPVAYYFPPANNRNTILVYYIKSNPDLSEPLFLLFHEAGHCRQYGRWKNGGREKDFLDIASVVSGQEEVDFERDAWITGEELLRDYIAKEGLGNSIIDEYIEFGNIIVDSYA